MMRWVFLLALFQLGSGKPGCQTRSTNDTSDLACPGDGGYACHRIPTILKTANGTLLAMHEARKFSCADHGWVDLRLRRSHDGGKTWEPSRLMYGNSTQSQSTTVGDGNWVQDVTTGTIWLFHTRNNSHFFVSNSYDEGASWTAPRDVSDSLKLGSGIGTGHAAGIQLSSGPVKGRLIVPVYSSGSYVVYSDDHGASWEMGGIVPNATSPHAPSTSSEWSLAETGAYAADGTPILLASIRNTGRSQITGKEVYRFQSLSHDGGRTWGAVWVANQLPETLSGCEGSLAYHPGTRKLYFSHPDPKLGLIRSFMTVWSSSNLGATWNEHAVIYREVAGYSSLAVTADGRLGLFYEREPWIDGIRTPADQWSLSWTTVPA